MTNHLDRMLKKAEALACQCEPEMGYSCSVHQLFADIRIAIGETGWMTGDAAPEPAEELEPMRTKAEAV